MPISFMIYRYTIKSLALNQGRRFHFLMMFERKSAPHSKGSRSHHFGEYLYQQKDAQRLAQHTKDEFIQLGSARNRLPRYGDDPCHLSIVRK